MKSIWFLVVVLALSGCTDAARSSFQAYGEEADITCFSGGNIIYADTSTGKVEQLDGDGITFRSKYGERYVRAFADCIVQVK